MGRVENEGEIVLSVVDRLIDLEPDVSSEVPAKRSVALRQLKAALRRDLEWLLNTRQIPESVPEGLSETRRSLYTYGLPDINSLGLQSARSHARLLRSIESAVSAFEPRLTAVRVTLEAASVATRNLRFQIQGMLRVEPAPEHVTFDTVLELTSGEYEVK